MKCESCGHEVEEIGTGIVVSARDAGFIGLGITIPAPPMMDKQRITFFVGPHAGTTEWIKRVYVKVEHGYIHINRTELDYTRHAI